METKRKIIEFDITVENYSDFLESKKTLFISELVSAAEEIVKNNLDSAVVCKLRVKLNDRIVIINSHISVNDLFDDLPNLLDWTVENEEYELSHKIKLLLDYIKENDIRRKVEETIRANEKFEERGKKTSRPISN